MSATIGGSARTSTPVVGTKPSTCTTPLATLNHQRQRRACLRAELGRQLLRQQHGVGLDDQAQEARVIRRGRGLQLRAACRFARIGSIPSNGTRKIGSTLDADLAFDDGCGSQSSVAQHEVAKDPLVEAALERQRSDG